MSTFISVPNHSLMLLALIFVLGSPSFICFAAASNQCFGANDGGPFGTLRNAVRDYMSQDCLNNNNCAVGQTYGWPMNSWCVGNVTDMSYLFAEMEGFNEDISGWDTSSVINMENMLWYATSFNGDLSSWNTTNVWNMAGMFEGATSFNGNLSSWNTSNVILMVWMFYGATSFNQDLCAWRDEFPYNDASLIFANSGCTYQDDPQEDQKGPFCASDCNGDTPSTASTPKSSGAVY